MPEVDDCRAVRNVSAGGVPVLWMRRCEVGLTMGGDGMFGVGYWACKIALWDGMGGEATEFECGDELIALEVFEVLGFRGFLGEGFADLDDCSGEGSEGERSELMSMAVTLRQSWLATTWSAM